MGPISVSERVDFFQDVVLGEVDGFFYHEADIVLIFQQVHLLLVVHDKQRLRHSLVRVVFNALTVGLQGHDPPSCQLVDFFLGNLVVFR